MMMIHRAHVRTAAAIVILLVAPVWAPAAWAQAQAAAPAQAATPAAAQAPAGTKKIVFLAGPKDHGAVGRHEYEKDLRELAWSLENASNLEDITTEVLVGKAPRDLSVLEDASAIVIVGSGD
jgi:hypothetical protein